MALPHTLLIPEGSRGGAIVSRCSLGGVGFWFPLCFEILCKKDSMLSVFFFFRFQSHVADGRRTKCCPFFGHAFEYKIMQRYARISCTC